MLGDREDREGLSGRGLGMSMWSRGRALPVSLAWRVFEKGLSLEPALSVGATAACGNGDAGVLGEETVATGVVGLLRVKSRRGSEDPGSSNSTTFRLSPMDTERDIFAMELVVGLMYERDLGLVGVVMSRVRVVRGTVGRERRGVVWTLGFWVCGWTSLDGRGGVWTTSADTKREM